MYETIYVKILLFDLLLNKLNNPAHHISRTKIAKIMHNIVGVVIFCANVYRDSFRWRTIYITIDEDIKKEVVNLL